MKQVAHTPTRIDLAGGTLDIWPLNLLVEHTVTVNVAIDLWATCTVEPPAPDDAGKPSSRAVLRSEDSGIEETWDDAGSPPSETKLPLLARCVRYLEPERGFRLTTRCASPAGAGLGGSSSLVVSLLGALQSFLGRAIMPPEDMIGVARDLEAAVLQVPTGTQDHFAATFGGAAAIHHGPGRPRREPLAIDLDRLGQRLVLAYTGASRLSSMANWDMVRRAVDGDEITRSALAGIAAIAQEMRAALVEDDLDAVAELMDREWAERKRLSPKVSTDLIERTIGVARKAGAIGGKVCGAGGGGCVALLCHREKRDLVVGALEWLADDGVRLLDARPTAVGLQLAG